MTTTLVKPNWEELVSTSYYETISTIEEQIKHFDSQEALVGLRYLYENMSKQDRREFQNFLILVMTHVLKWKYQPSKRSNSWRKTIRNGRREMQRIFEDTPSVNQEYALSIWGACTQDAIEDAKDEMNLSRKDIFEPAPLTWEEVFEDEYLV